jgi:hypothetical protein
MLLQWSTIDPKEYCGSALMLGILMLASLLYPRWTARDAATF